MGVLASKKLNNNPIFYGIIADGIHTHPTALRMAVRTNMDGLVAVSDAIVAMGLTDGKYTFGAQEIGMVINKIALIFNHCPLKYKCTA